MDIFSSFQFHKPSQVFVKPYRNFEIKLLLLLYHFTLHLLYLFVSLLEIDKLQIPSRTYSLILDYLLVQYLLFLDLLCFITLQFVVKT